MRPTTIAIAAALAVSAAGVGAALRGPSGDEHSSEPAPAARVAAAAGAVSAAPPQVPVSSTEEANEALADGDALDAPPVGSTLQRELSEPERREAEAYPWEEFEAVLGRSITAEERDHMRELRKEHGLRLAEARGRMERGEMPRAEFDAWRAARSSEFRAEVREALGCSPDQVAALLSTPLHQPGP